MKTIEKIRDEIAIVKDMLLYSLNDVNQTEDVIKRNERLMKRLAKLERKLNQMYRQQQRLCYNSRVSFLALQSVRSI